MADETFLTPAMHRDLIGPKNSPMGMALGAMTAPANPYRYTNLLGGVTMAPALSSDVYGMVKRGQQRNIKNMGQVAMAVGGSIAAIFAGSKFHKLFKSIGKVFKK